MPHRPLQGLILFLPNRLPEGEGGGDDIVAGAKGAQRSPHPKGAILLHITIPLYINITIHILIRFYIRGYFKNPWFLFRKPHRGYCQNPAGKNCICLIVTEMLKLLRNRDTNTYRR